MSAGRLWRRPLQGIAIALGLAIVVLGTVVLQRDPPPPPANDPDAAALGEAPAAIAEATRAARTAAAPGLGTEAASASDVAVDVPAVLYGTVVQADGSPVPRGTLFAYRDDQHVGTAACQQGRFAFAGLRPGPHELRGRIDDQLPLLHRVQVEAPRTRLDLRLDARWSLTVNAVTPDGQPLRAKQPHALLRGLTAAAFAEPLVGDLPPSGLAVSDAGLGSYRDADLWSRDTALPKQVLGVLALPPDQPLHIVLLLRSTVLAQQLVAAGQAEVTFTLPAEALLARLADVRLRLVDAAGAPVRGARVRLDDRQTGSSGLPTDDEGRVVFRRLAPGLLRLVVRHETLCAPPVTLDVPAGGDVDLGDVVLQAVAKLEFDLGDLGDRGRLTWALMEALPRADWHHEIGWHMVESDDTPTLRLFPGRYTFLARGATGVTIAEIDTRMPPLQPIRLSLQPAAALRIQNRVGQGMVVLRVRTTSGALLLDQELTGTWTRVERLPAGTYEVELVGAGNASTRRQLQLGPAGAVLSVP